MAGFDDRDRSAAGAAQVDVGRGRSPVQYQPVGRRRSAPGGDQRGEHRRGPARRRTVPGRPRSAAARPPRSTGAGRARTGWSGRARSPPPAGRRAPPGGGPGRCPADRRGRRRRTAPRRPARPARPACCHSEASVPGIAGEHDGVQPGDVDAQLQGVGRGQPEQLAAAAAPVPGPGAPRAGSRPGRRPPGRPARGPTSASARRAIDATSSAPWRERTNASVRAPCDDRVGEQIGGLGRSADRRTGAAVLDLVASSGSSGGSHSAKVTAAARRAVLGDRASPAARSAAGGGRPGRRRSPRRG